MLCDLDCYSPHAYDMITFEWMDMTPNNRNNRIFSKKIINEICGFLFIQKQGMKQCPSGILEVKEERFLKIKIKKDLN